MNKKAFTMVELIIVIVIIGILATVALPKFNNTKNLAKINSEVASINSLDSVIMVEMETQDKRYGNSEVNWHNFADMNDSASGNRAKHYKSINEGHLVLSKIAKRNKGFNIVAWKAIDKNGNSSYTDGLFYDAIVIKSEATKGTTGAKYPNNVAGNDIEGEPDKNDFWVFNPSSVDLTIKSRNLTIAPINPMVVPSGEMKLIDVNGTTPITNITYIGVSGFSNSPNSLYYFSATAN